jgi:hypothetical protein
MSNNRLEMIESPTFRGMPEELKLPNIPEKQSAFSEEGVQSPTFAKCRRSDTAFFG